MPSGFPFSRIATRVPSSLSGVLYSTAGVLSAISTTGSGNAVLATSPTITTPTIASLIGNKIYPASNGTAAIQFNKADGTTNVVTIDTTNAWVGFGAAPICRLDLGGALTTNAQIKVGSLHFQGYAINNSGITDNLYWNTAWKYRDSGYGIVLSLVNGAITVRTAPSGTAGWTATVTDRFTITNGGNVGIGLTAPNARLEVLSTTEQLRLSYDSTHYASHTVDASGYLTIAPSGNVTKITGALTIGSSGQATITTGGYAQLGWGSASTPAFSFSSAANYGIYYASSAVRISAAGSEVARFSAGGCTAIQFRLSALNTAPSSASDTGTLGEIRIVDGYIYVCTATDTWKRAAIATWA